MFFLGQQEQSILGKAKNFQNPLEGITKRKSFLF